MWVTLWVPSSRKSATNSVLWFMGDDIPHVPTSAAAALPRRQKLRQSSLNTMEDAAHCRSKWTFSNLNMGDVIDVYPYKAKCATTTNELLASFELKPTC